MSEPLPMQSEFEAWEKDHLFEGDQHMADFYHQRLETGRYADNRTFLAYTAFAAGAACASQGRVDPVSPLWIDLETARPKDRQEVFLAFTMEGWKSWRYESAIFADDGDGCYFAYSSDPERWIIEEDLDAVRWFWMPQTDPTAALCASQSPSPWLPLDVEAQATDGDRILVFLPNTHETLPADFEEMDDEGNGLWSLPDGREIEARDGALWTELPVPNKPKTPAPLPYSEVKGQANG